MLAFLLLAKRVMASYLSVSARKAGAMAFLQQALTDS